MCSGIAPPGDASRSGATGQIAAAGAVVDHLALHIRQATPCGSEWLPGERRVGFLLPTSVLPQAPSALPVPHSQRVRPPFAAVVIASVQAF